MLPASVVSIPIRKHGILQYALVRHPVVTGAAGRCYGRLDLPLAEPETAIPALVDRLRPMRGAALHTSPLTRCRRLADALAAAWGMPPPIPDPRLLELDFGAWEGLRWDDIPRPALDAWAADLSGFAPPGGESGAALVTRVTAFWASLVAQGGSHVIITHGGPLRVLAALAEGRAVDLGHPAPAPGSVILGQFPPSENTQQ